MIDSVKKEYNVKNVSNFCSHKPNNLNTDLLIDILVFIIFSQPFTI